MTAWLYVRNKSLFTNHFSSSDLWTAVIESVSWIQEWISMIHEQIIQTSVVNERFIKKDSTQKIQDLNLDLFLIQIYHMV